MSTFKLIEADCIGAMASMDEASVDAIVTDPPYLIEFMSKTWDRPGDVRQPNDPTFHKSGSGPHDRATVRYGYDVDVSAMQTWHHAWATQALRVLKPGGHLLAFGGTRTYHRLTCALEDAGFEIRDCLAWLYGSGFPKSLDVSKAIDKARDDSEAKWAVADWLRPHIERVGFAVVTAAFGFGDETMARARWTSRSQTNTPTWDQWLKLKELCGFGDEMDAEVWRLNGRKGTPGEAWAQREVVGVETTPWKVDEAVKRTTSYNPTGPTIDENGYRYTVHTAPHLDEAQRWQGWGTALKPAFEPIVLARKPLIGSVARNVQEFGTGALNIDGTRIGTDAPLGRFNHAKPEQHRVPDSHPDAKHLGRMQQTDALIDNSGGLGRWPANVILDEEAAAMLDEQSGETGVSKGGWRGTSGDGWGFAPQPGKPLGFGDSGGASRFFKVVGEADDERCTRCGSKWWSCGHETRFRYTSKADREERNRGLGGERNIHPTLKPVELMQWLCRLICPPGGVVLDPFTGSGSTGMAALREGFDFIGIEREHDYVEIARARIIGDGPLLNLEKE